jgi:plastocyanin
VKIERVFAIASGVFLFSLSGPGDLAAHEKLSKSVCANPKPETLCDSGNTCGKKTVPCAVDVKRTASSTSATAAVPNAKGNQVFCVAVGTPVKWYSTSKKTGFIVDFGSASPFAEETVIGGSDREVSTVTKKPGCYKYSVGACYSGGLSGMCESAEAEVIATGGK